VVEASSLSSQAVQSAGLTPFFCWFRPGLHFLRVREPRKTRSFLLPQASTILAARAIQEDHERNRVYDKDHKDYHNWDDKENRAWGQFLTENHGESHEYAKANKKEQSKYWNWRHSHPDKD
jgi:hypothetical protein